MSEPQIDIRPDHWAIVRDILQRHVPQYAVWAFGSRAKWTAKEYSDLDLAIITDRPLPLATSAALAEDFSESDLPWKVDIVDWAETSEAFRQIIERDRVVVQDASSVTVGWQRITLGELVSLQRGHDLTEEERHPGMVPVMGSAGQNGYHDKALMKGPGIVIGRSGASFGQVHFCAKDYWPHNTTLYVTDFHGNDPYFTFYFLRNLDFTRYNSGSAQPSLNRNYIYPIKIKIPPISEQRSIAHILGTLDDRIELNRQMNETLESMARSLFKSWFIDFDGVSAEDLQESELGFIPKGWNVIAFGDVAQQGKGTVNPMASAEEIFTHYSLPAFDVAQLPVRELGEAIKSNKTPVPNESVLVSKLNPHIPRIWLVGDAGHNAVCSTEFIVWTPKQPANNAFIHVLASSAEFNSAMRQLVTGTSNSHQRVKPEQLANIRVIAANDEAISKFSLQVKPLMEKILHHRQQSQALAQLRDTLLPKLISGEVRIKDAERLAETA